MGRGIYYMETMGVWIPTAYGQGYLLYENFECLDTHYKWAGLLTVWKLWVFDTTINGQGYLLYENYVCLDIYKVLRVELQGDVL